MRSILLKVGGIVEILLAVAMLACVIAFISGTTLNLVSVLGNVLTCVWLGCCLYHGVHLYSGKSSPITAFVPLGAYVALVTFAVIVSILDPLPSNASLPLWVEILVWATLNFAPFLQLASIKIALSEEDRQRSVFEEEV